MASTKKLLQHPAMRIVLATASCVVIILGLVGAYVIYVNNKTDGFGHGEITVKSCRAKDTAWRIYSCVGDYFSTGGGMIGRKDVSVTTFTRSYVPGEKIPDVYAPAFSDSMTTNHFVTGRERASVLYNTPWLLAVFAGLLFPIVAAVLIVTSKN